LGGLPLAIAQAAAFLSESGIELEIYIGFYEQQWKDLMDSRDWADAPLHDYPDRSIWTTWAITYNTIRERHVATANLILPWAFLDSKDLWYGLFAAVCNASTTAATSLSGWIGDVASNELEFGRAMQLLRNYTLIEEVEGLASYSTHPVVHRWAYYYQGKCFELKLARLVVNIVGCAVPSDTSRDNWTMERRLLSHAQACSRWLSVALMERNSSHNGYDVDFKETEEERVVDAMNLLGNLYSPKTS
jgi:hypothetical protein